MFSLLDSQVDKIDSFIHLHQQQQCTIGGKNDQMDSNQTGYSFFRKFGFFLWLNIFFTLCNSTEKMYYLLEENQ